MLAAQVLHDLGLVSPINLFKVIDQSKIRHECSKTRENLPQNDDHFDHTGIKGVYNTIQYKTFVDGLNFVMETIHKPGIYFDDHKDQTLTLTGGPKMLLKVDCLPNAVGKQPSIPLIHLGRKRTLN